MAGLMASIRIGVVTLLAVVLLNAIGVFSLGDVSAAGEAGIAKVPGLFKDNGNKGGNGGGNGNGNGGQGNGNQDVADDADDSDEGDEDNGKKDKKAKGEKKDKKDKSEKAADESDDDSDDADDDSDSDKNPQSGNVDCDDVDAMIEYLMNRNMNGALHANENGADNAALGALNKCRDKSGDEDSDD